MNDRKVRCLAFVTALVFVLPMFSAALGVWTPMSAQARSASPAFQGDSRLFPETGKNPETTITTKLYQ